MRSTLWFSDWGARTIGAFLVTILEQQSFQGSQTVSTYLTFAVPLSELLQWGATMRWKLPTVLQRLQGLDRYSLRRGGMLDQCRVWNFSETFWETSRPHTFLLRITGPGHSCQQFGQGEGMAPLLTAYHAGGACLHPLMSSVHTDCRRLLALNFVTKHYDHKA